MAKAVQSSNAAASPAMGLVQAEFMSPEHVELLEKFKTDSAKLGKEFQATSRRLAEEFARKLKNLAPFNEESPCSTSSSSEHAGSDSERLEEPDDDDNDDEESLSPSADSTSPFVELGVPKPKPQVNGDSLKNSTKLESKERKKKKMLTVNGISKTDTSESPAAVGLDLSQKVGEMVLGGAIMVNGDGESTDRKERIRSSKLDYKRLDELYNKTTHDFYFAESSQSPAGKEDKWEEYLFVIRRRFDWQNKYQKTYVDIKSIEIRTVLREILKDVSGIGLREDKPTVEPNLLFNYLPQLEIELTKARDVPEEQQNKTLISHLTLFNEYISTDYASTIKRLYPLLEHHEITFDLLWALFLPNTLIYTICAGSNEPRCLKLDWGEQKETLDRGKFFQLDCHYVDYDGKTYGEASAVLEIDEFRGARRIDSLGVFPLAYHEDEEDVRERLIERGRKFGSLKGMHYKYYKGLAFFKRKRGVVRVNVNGRIMVDPSTFRRINPNYRMSPVKESSSHSSSGAANAEDDSENENEDEDEDCGGGDDDEDGEINSPNNMVKPKASVVAAAVKRAIGTKPQRSYILGPDGKIKLVGTTPGATKKKLLETGKTAERIKDALVPEEMTEEQLLLCSPTVLGFSFGDKLWAEFAVEHVNEIKFNPDAFESLVLPKAQKKIVKALVESHTSNRGSRPGIDDVIKGKGKGLVAVLHGRPGVGKTLTAEGISEFLQKPLYMVGAGELGTDSRTLETQLSRILDIAHVWGAVLLLDEADVFLERRSVHDLQRNALVSIFLRLLEYFQGILFLTTNRVETFDEAFQSRIHIALRYNDLDKKARRVIWKTFLGMVAREESGSDCQLRDIVSDEELEGLARRELNGRQIKNAVRTAQALALNKNEGLSMEHLKLVLAVTEGFEQDLKGTGNLDSMMSYA
ncbi:hypothetical protein B9Z19DRAFT_1078786 [Tuber borchii]|uniref:AAA+ ATPase domain-containing protein n=1 Tax=Tuber borchii TaxID=42251 RepID=A0A2T6ZYX2_TUBBO|nr:hypothetical protein B9Z19DRAFT_1078786 [Tuber borchii]